MGRPRKTIFSKVFLLWGVILVCIHLAPLIVREGRFFVATWPLYHAALRHQNWSPDQCAKLETEALHRYTNNQHFVIGSLVLSLKCADLAALILPEFTADLDRSFILAYQWGLVLWARGDSQGAAAIWRQSKGIDQRLLYEARQLKEIDFEEAQRWYEAAIMSASSPQMLAESITAYSEEMFNHIPYEETIRRLVYLASYYGEKTATGYRLRGEQALRGGNYQSAYEFLSQAISLGVSDAETWYLLGEAAWKINDLLTAEQALRSALNAPIQISWRQTWHLNRLAALMKSQGRLNEAILFQEEAVHLSNYYVYTDNLAVLYAEFGQAAKAQALCTKARSLAGSIQTTLQCEER